MAKTATYYSPNGTARELTVLREHPAKDDKPRTVDLGKPAADGKPEELDIGLCPIALVPTVGHCVIHGEHPPKPEKPK